MIMDALNDIWDAFRQYSSQALLYGVIAVTIYTIFAVLRNIYCKIRKKKCQPVRKLVFHIFFVALFGIYLSYVIALTLSGREPGSRFGSINLVVFSTLIRNDGLDLSGVENILLFFPMGILVPVIWRGFRRWWNLVLGAFVASTTIECLQYVTLRGYLEIDDIILNIAGAWIGYSFFFLFFATYCAIRHRLRKDDAPVNRISLIFIQLLTIIFMLFVIFGFSGQQGMASGNTSLKVTQKIIELADQIGLIRVDEIRQPALAMEWEGYVRKAAHFTEYAFLALSIAVFLYCRKLRWIGTFLLTELLVIIVAVVDEWNQTQVYGRKGALMDIGIDGSGALGMLAIMSVVLAIGRLIEKRKGH